MRLIGLTLPRQCSRYAIRDTGHNRATYISKTYHVLHQLGIMALVYIADNAEESFDQVL